MGVLERVTNLFTYFLLTFCVRTPCTLQVVCQLKPTSTSRIIESYRTEPSKTEWSLWLGK